MSTERTLRYKKNVVLSTVFLSFSALLGYILVPISLKFLGPERYGLWAVLGSVFMWLGLLNMGYGGGLRFHLARSLAKNETVLARQYVSTTYALFGIISILLLAVFFGLNNFINWSVLFNTPAALVHEMNTTVVVMVVFFSINFIISLGRIVLVADQRNSSADFFTMLANALTIAGIAPALYFFPSSLVLYCLLVRGPALLSNIVMSLFIYAGKYRFIRPSFKQISFKLARSYSGVSTKFMYMQVAFILAIVANNILIAHLLGPSQVTVYNIALQYISVGTFLFRMLVAPSGSAMIEAHAVKDKTWIKKTLFFFIKVWIFLIIGLIGMTLVSPWVYPLWIGDSVNIPLRLTFIVMVSEVLINWNSIFSSHVVGTGRLFMVMVLATLRIVIHIPLAIFMVRFCKMGLEGIVISSALCTLFSAVILPVQSRLMINGRAKGIWNA